MLTKQKISLGRMPQGTSSTQEYRRTALPPDSVSGFMVIGVSFQVVSGHSSCLAHVWSDSGSFLGEGHGHPLQYSCLENSMDRRAWGEGGYSPWSQKESDMTKRLTLRVLPGGKRISQPRWILV